MHRFAKFLAHAVVFAALSAAIVFAFKHGLERGSDGWYQFALVIALCAVAIGEFLFWHSAACAWFERSPGALIFHSVLGACLTCGVLYTNFASSAANNDGKAGVQLSTFNVQTDIGKAIQEEEARVSRLEQRLRMKPQRTPEQARSAMDNARSHRFWGMTEHCTKTMGPATRKFCDEFRSAEADEKGGTRALVDDAELAGARTSLAELREKRAAQPKALASAESANLLFLARYTQTSIEEARQLDSMVVPFLVQAMLLLGGICLAIESYRGKPRPPWINWRRVGHFISCTVAMIRGQPLPVFAPADMGGRRDGIAIDPAPASGAGGAAGLASTAVPLVPVDVPPYRAEGSLQVVQHTFSDRAFARTASDALADYRSPSLAA